MIANVPDGIGLALMLLGGLATFLLVFCEL